MSLGESIGGKEPHLHHGNPVTLCLYCPCASILALELPNDESLPLDFGVLHNPRDLRTAFGGLGDGSCKVRLIWGH